jgi:hypothetical protein
VPIHVARQPPQQLRSGVGQRFRQATLWTRQQQSIKYFGERCVRNVRIGGRTAYEHGGAVIDQRSGNLGG